MDGEWATRCQLNGLASGEALVSAVCDPVTKKEPIRKQGRVVEYQDIITDHGVNDKRLLVIEPEFARLLQVAERENSTLSANLRLGWDGNPLQVKTKKETMKATGAHVGLIGHITGDELRRLLTDTATFNGFANRILWVCVQRSKSLPDGGNLDPRLLDPIISRLKVAVGAARTITKMERDPAAAGLWRTRLYDELTQDRAGLLGFVTLRGAAQVLRLSCVYALLDGTAIVAVPHLLAALEVWRYCYDSARFIFGEALGDPSADTILQALRRSPGGITRTEISRLFHNNAKPGVIQGALGVLQRNGHARVELEGETGRKVERWSATK
jgi:hypothetical protein